MLETLMRGRHKDYMKFHNTNVIDISESSSTHDEWSSDISTDSSDSDAPKADDKPVTTYHLARKEYLFGNMEKAFIYSVIRGLDVSEKDKSRVIEAEFKRIKNAQGADK